MNKNVFNLRKRENVTKVVPNSDSTFVCLILNNNSLEIHKLDSDKLLRVSFDLKFESQVIDVDFSSPLYQPKLAVVTYEGDVFVYDINNKEKEFEYKLTQIDLGTPTVVKFNMDGDQLGLLTGTSLGHLF